MNVCCIKAKKREKIFQQQYRIVSVTLYNNLVKECSTLNIDDNLKRVLSAQIVNYLLGQDIENVVLNIKDEVLETNFDKIKDKIKLYAEDKMSRDLEVRKLVVYTLRMHMALQECLLGKKYHITSDYERDYNLLLKYGNEFPDEVKQNMYMELCENFVQREMV